MEIEFTSLASFFVTGLFYLLLLVFTLHALFLSYHWFSYGNSKRISMTALAVYLCGGAFLFITLAVALSYI